MKTLEYTLLALTLTESGCISIMAHVLSRDLPNMGICRNIARSLVYTPVKHQGVGINKSYTTQGLIYVMEMTNHIWRRIETCKLIFTSIEYTKLEIGLKRSLFKQYYNEFGFLCEKYG